MPAMGPAMGPTIVPHIFRFNGDALEICGPYMTVDRPTDFEGPGMVIMHRPSAIDEENKVKPIEGLTEREKIFGYITEFTKILPEKKLEEPSPMDSPDVQQKKVLDGIKFQNGVHKVETMYGESTIETIFVIMSKNGILSL